MPDRRIIRTTLTASSPLILQVSRIVEEWPFMAGVQAPAMNHATFSSIATRCGCMESMPFEAKTTSDTSGCPILARFCG